MAPGHDMVMSPGSDVVPCQEFLKSEDVGRTFLFLTNFSGHADGERRGLDRVGGKHRKKRSRCDAPLGNLRMGTGPRSAPSACSEMYKKSIKKMGVDSAEVAELLETDRRPHFELGDFQRLAVPTMADRC